MGQRRRRTAGHVDDVTWISKSPPDLDRNPVPTDLWTEARMQGVLSAIEDRFGVVLEPTAARAIETFADLAAAVQCAVWERQGHASRKPFSE